MHTDMASIIEHYLQSIHQLASAGQEDTRDDLIQLIDRCLTSAEPESPTHAFFLAEQAFYHRRYKDALQRYLPLSQIPLHLFFCYRASAFLVATLGQTEKALDYAKRALGFQHHDLETLRLCKELSTHVTDAVAAIEQIVEEDVQETGNKSGGDWSLINVWTSDQGHYLRWNGLGIVINPGPKIRETFHEQGLSLQMVDCVIASSDDPEYHAGIRAIETAANEEGHQDRIHYYLWKDVTSSSIENF